MIRRQFPSSLLLLLALLVVAMTTSTVSAELTGNIGDIKNNIPKGEVMDYKGISIEWIRGKRAILTIFEDGVQKETVELYPLKTREDMHQLMQDKGFEKKSPEEQMHSLQVERREAQIEKMEKSAAGQSLYGGMIIVYGMVVVVVAGLVIFVNNKKKNKSLRTTTANNLVSRV